MASVGSVELSLELNRAAFNRDLTELQSLKLEPLKLGVELDGKNLRSRLLQTLRNSSYGAIALDLTPNIKGFERKIRDLPKSIPAIEVDVDFDLTKIKQTIKRISLTDIQCIDICLDPDIEGFREKLAQLYKLDINCIPIDLCPDLKGLDSKVRAGLSGKKYSTDIGLNTGGFKDNIEGAFTDALKRVQGKGIFSSIGGLLTAPLKLAIGAIAPIFVGLGAAIGFPLGAKLGSGLAKGIESAAAPIIGSFELLGEKAVTSVAPKLGQTFIGRFVATVIQSDGLKKLSTDISNYLKDAVGEADILIESKSQSLENAHQRKRKQQRAAGAIGQELKTEIENAPQRSEQIKKVENSLKKARLDAELKRKNLGLVQQSAQLRIARTSQLDPNFSKIVEKENFEIDKATVALSNAFGKQRTFEKVIESISKRPEKLTGQLRTIGVDTSSIDDIQSALKQSASKGQELITRLDGQIKIQQANIREARSRLKTYKELNGALTKEITDAIASGDDSRAKSAILERKKNAIRASLVSSEEIPGYKASISEIIHNKESTVSEFIGQRKNLKELIPQEQLNLARSAINNQLSTDREQAKPLNRKRVQAKRSSKVTQESGQEIAIKVANQVEPILPPPLAFEKIFQEVARLSSSSISSQKIPSLKRASGAKFAGRYDSLDNSISLPSQTYDDLKKGIITPAVIEAITHELRHAFQTGFGEISLGSAKSPAKVPLVKGSKEELKLLGSRINASTAAFKQRAFSATPQDVAHVKRLEEDAYVFTHRHIKEVFTKVGAALKESATEIKKQLESTGTFAPILPEKELLEAIEKEQSEITASLKKSIKGSPKNRKILDADLAQKTLTRIDEQITKASGQLERDDLSIEAKRKLGLHKGTLERQYRAYSPVIRTLQSQNLNPSRAVESTIKQNTSLFSFNNDDLAKELEQQRRRTVAASLPPLPSFRADGKREFVPSEGKKSTYTKELGSVLDGANKALAEVDSLVIESINSATKEAKFNLRSIRQINAVGSRRIRSQSKTVDRSLELLESQTEKEIASNAQNAEALRVQKLRRVENRLQRRYDIQPSIPVSPLPLVEGDGKSEVKSIGGAIRSVFKGLQTSRFDAAKKQAESLTQQANILLIDINSTIAIGKAAEAEAKLLQKAIAANERKVEAILGQIRKASSGRSPKLTPGDLQRLTGQASDLNKQIDADRESLAAANLRATKGNQLQPFVDKLKAGADASGAETDLKRIQDLNRELKQTFRSLGENPSTSFFSSLDEGISGLIPKLGGLVKGFLAFQGALILQNGLSTFARGAIDAAVKLDKLQTTLKFASGSEVAGTRNLEFVRSEVERLKVPLATSTEGFTKLAAATKGTALAGRATRDTFTGISSAASVLSLTADETSGAILALTQIASKGKVQAEELRGQLGERIPGAFSIAARSMGVTESQLNKLLETGQVLAADFLPRFAKQLNTEFGAAAVEASGNAQSAIVGLQNTILSLQESAGKSILPVFIAGLNALSGILKTVSGSMGEIVLAVGALTIALSVKLGLALKETIANLILTRATGGTLAGAFNDVARYINNSATVKITAGIFAVIEAVKLLNDTVNTDLVKSFKTAADAAERAAGASKKSLLPESPNNKSNDLPTVNPVDSFVRNSVKQPFLLKPFFGLPEAVGRGANFLKTGKFDYVNYAELQRDNLISSLGDFNFGNNQLISSGRNSLQNLRSLGGVGGADEELRSVQSNRAILQAEIERKFSKKGLLIPPEYQKQVEDLTTKIEKLSEMRAGLAKPLTEDLVRVTNQLAATRSQIQSLEDPKTIAALGGEKEAARQKQQLQNTLDALRQFKFDVESALGSLKLDPVLAFTKEITKLNIELAKNQEVTQKAFLTQKAQISRDSVATFSTDKILSDTTALKNAVAERDRMGLDLTASEKDFKSKTDAIAAPEFNKTLQKFGLMPNSSVAEISAKIDIAEDADKKTLELIKLARESEAKVLEVRTQAAEAEQKLQQARQSSALNSLQRYADQALALSKRTENQQTAVVKFALHQRTISEEEGAVRQSQIQLQSVARQKDVVDSQLNLLRYYGAVGQVGAEEYTKRERELLNQQSDFKRQVAEAEIAAREAEYKQILDLASLANQKVEGAIALNLTKRNTAAKQLQLQLLNTTGDQKGGELKASGLSIEAEKLATEERINLIKVELEQVKISEEQKYITVKEATAKRRQLLQQLADANLKRVDTELAQEKNYREQVLQLIESQKVSAINSSNLAVNGIERQKDAQNLLNQSLERSQKLEQSRYDLRKATADAAVGESQIQLDRVNQALELPGANKPELLQQRLTIENDIAQKRLDALRAEQKFQQQNLQLELQKQAIVAKTAHLEAEITRLKAQQAIIEANAALAKAVQNKDTLAIDAAKLGLEIATRQLELSDRQLENARENLKIQSELASNATQAQKVQQQSAIESAIAADLVRKQKPINSFEESRQGADNLSPSNNSSKLKKDNLSQSQLKVFAPADTFTRKYLPPDQSGSRGLNPRTSVEAFFKRQKGLDPTESNENYFKRQMGLDKYKSVEDYFNQSLGITPTDLVSASKPIDVKPQSTGFTEFTKGLAEANRGIEAKLQALIDVTSKSANSPRSLYVSSPTPVSDAARIWGDISRGIITASGLG